MNYEGEKFLFELYKDLHKKDSIKNLDKRSDEKSSHKNELLRKYLKRLERQEKIFNGEHVELEKYLKKRYFNRYVIKEEEIPESYYEHLNQISLDQGQGNINFTEERKHQEAKKIIKDQELSLEKWINYLLKENTSYPMWARYWVFKSIVKLGNYNKKTHSYSKRSNGTVAPFPELNAEALAKTFDLIVDHQNKKDISDTELKDLINTGSFSKIYSYNIRKILEEEKNNINNKNDVNDGIWKDYYKGDEEEIVKSLDGKGTGWCIAGLNVAKDYLNYDGRLTIYYTKDKNGNYTIPRACIRSYDYEIQEVRGIDKDQNMEYELIEIVDKKLDEYPDKYEYKNKIKDMKKVTEIYNKFKKQEQLTKEEFYFIYEIDREIMGFGWDLDPRIDEIKDNVLEYTRKEMKEDKDFIKNIVNKDGYYFRYASDELRNDKELVLEAIKQHCYILEYASKELKNDKEIVLEAVKQHGDILRYASENLKNDEEVVLTAVQRSSTALKYASIELKNNKEFIKRLVKDQPEIFKYISENLKKDKEFIMEIAKINGHILDNVNETIKQDQGFLIELLTNQGYALKYISKELRNNREFVLNAIKNDSNAIKYASKELRNDKEIVIAAVEQSINLLIYASDELKKDREFILYLVKEKGLSFALVYADESLKNDKEIVLEAIKNEPTSIKYVSKELKQNISNQLNENIKKTL